MIPLTACSKVTSNVDCGLLLPYSKEYQTALSEELKELKELNKYPKIEKGILDYDMTRRSIRKCREALIYE